MSSWLGCTGAVVDCPESIKVSDEVDGLGYAYLSLAGRTVCLCRQALQTAAI